jgi:hypothetical protein
MFIPMNALFMSLAVAAAGQALDAILARAHARGKLFLACLLMN